MAVENHPVHERTKDKGVPYGCWNRKRDNPGYYAPRRIFKPSGKFIVELVFIRNEMSKDCRYDLSLGDGKCAGCKQRGNGEKRSEAVRLAASVGTTSEAAK